MFHFDFSKLNFFFFYNFVWVPSLEVSFPFGEKNKKRENFFLKMSSIEKCRYCDCKSFEANIFKNDICSSCFHKHAAGSQVNLPAFSLLEESELNDNSAHHSIRRNFSSPVINPTSQFTEQTKMVEENIKLKGQLRYIGAMYQKLLDQHDQLVKQSTISSIQSKQNQSNSDSIFNDNDNNNKNANINSIPASSTSTTTTTNNTTTNAFKNSNSENNQQSQNSTLPTTTYSHHRRNSSSAGSVGSNTISSSRARLEMELHELRMLYLYDSLRQAEIYREEEKEIDDENNNNNNAEQTQQSTTTTTSQQQQQQQHQQQSHDPTKPPSQHSRNSSLLNNSDPISLPTSPAQTRTSPLKSTSFSEFTPQSILTTSNATGSSSSNRSKRSSVTIVDPNRMELEMSDLRHVYVYDALRQADHLNALEQENQSLHQRIDELHEEFDMAEAEVEMEAEKVAQRQAILEQDNENLKVVLQRTQQELHTQTSLLQQERQTHAKEIILLRQQTHIKIEAETTKLKRALLEEKKRYEVELVGEREKYRQIMEQQKQEFEVMKQMQELDALSKLQDRYNTLLEEKKTLESDSRKNSVTSPQVLSRRSSSPSSDTRPDSPTVVGDRKLSSSSEIQQSPSYPSPSMMPAHLSKRFPPPRVQSLESVHASLENDPVSVLIYCVLTF